MLIQSARVTQGGGVILRCHVKGSTLPSPTLPCGIQANSMESMWIPHGFQVKCPKKEIFTQNAWNPCGIHAHSRFIPCRVQKEVFSDYLHGIHGIQKNYQKKMCVLEIQVDCMDYTLIPGNIIQKKKSKTNPKQNPKKTL